MIRAENEPRPVTPEARLLQLDVLRGLALFGVLLVNLEMFCGAEFALEAKLPYPMGWGGEALAFLRLTLLEGKAVAMLAMLFGVGLAIQLESNQKRGLAFTPFALRRAGALTLFGLAHSFLLWNGDILLDYALISLMVLPFLRARTSRILWAIPLVLLVSLLVTGLLSGFLQAAHSQAQDQVYQLGLQHYGAGTWMEALKFRSWEMLHTIGPDRLSTRLVLLGPYFILGVFFWKKGFLSEPEQHLRALRILFYACFGLGLLANLIPQETLHAWVAGLPLRPLRVLIKLTAFFARQGVMFGYGAGILLLLRRPWWRASLSVFTPLGRMALSQYLLQSVVCTWIFNGYGLGLYGKVPTNLCILGGIAFFALQVWISRIWLARYAMGPAEWLWRRLTYGTLRPSPSKPLSPSLLASQEVP